MIPGYCPQDAAPGERRLYSELSSSAMTDGWIVLHSICIAEHIRQVEGESDFVVVVPNAGILVLEVKSHHQLQRNADGLWRLGNDAPTAKGPFVQARDAMYSLRNYLVKRNVDLKSIPMLYAVWFTHVAARRQMLSDPEWHEWQLLDSDDLKDVPAAIARTIQMGTRHLDLKIGHFSSAKIGPDIESATRIASVLRPKFEVSTSPGERRRERESQLFDFVDEQYRALDAAADNRAVLFSGPAGCGKTFLAIESARREVASGKRGRLLCFNRLLGKRLASELADVEGLTVSTLHQEFLRLANYPKVPDHADANFWENELPDRLWNHCSTRGNSQTGEFLVVDEIQDIARTSYLDVLDLMVSGGLSEGRLLFFGDFERQAIYENEGGRDSLRLHAPRLMSHRLLMNCRNLPRIGYQVNLLSHLRPGFQPDQFRRQDDGVDPTISSYKSGEDLSKKLVGSVRDLQQEGFALSEIVVLSPRRNESTAHTTSDPWLRSVLHLADGAPARKGQILYSTVGAFKGLEAPAVILVDVTQETPNYESLLYVGLTRATDRLIAFIEEKTLKALVGGTA